MTTTYDRMRAAADELNNVAQSDWTTAQEMYAGYESRLARHRENYRRMTTLARQLRLDADRLEALEKEMRDLRIRGADAREEWADTLRGQME